MSNVYRVLLVLLFLVLALTTKAADVVLQPSISDNRPLWISKINLSRQVVPRYENLELTFDLKGTYRNAFDPAEIDVNGIFVGPDNKTITVPAFLYQDYTRELRGNREYLTPKGSKQWRIRFAPVQIGKYSMTVTARDRTGKTVRSDKYSFECVESSNPGFVRKSRVDHRYFAFDNGKSYVPVGINVAWATSRGTYDYDDWFTQLGKAGCNYARVWITPGIITLASEKLGEPQDRYGIGKFDLASSWKLDYVVDLASRNGLYLMICTDSFNTLRMKKDGNHPFWEETPYNKTNNGPLEKPEDFWTNEAARSLYKNKLRYLVARYGWSTNVMCWEFWNEVDCVSPQVYNVDLITKWHIEMSDYLRNIDPWKHLHATSIGNSNGEKQFDQLPQMDFVQTHNYTTHDFTALFTEIQKKKEYYKKPHFISEFGWEGGGDNGKKIDPDGVALHNGIWSSLLSGGAGSAAYWWWDSFIHPKNHYAQFKALTSFIKGVDFDKERFQRIEDAVFSFAEQPSNKKYRDLRINGPRSWQRYGINKPTAMKIDRNGKVTVDGEVGGLLHPRAKPFKYNPLTIDMDIDHPTRLLLRVGEVSGHGGAHLVISIDGKVVKDVDMPDPDKMEKLESLTQYAGVYEVKIPSGKHTVKVDNIGDDWLIVEYILENAILEYAPDLRLVGLKGRNTSLLWVQNRDNTWHKVAQFRTPVKKQPESILQINNWPNGQYKVVFWDTYKGKQLSTSNIAVENQKLQLQLPAIEKDIAIRIDRIAGDR